MADAPLELYNATIKVVIYRKPYCIKDLEEMLKLFNEMHEHEMQVELAHAQKVLP